MTCGEEIWSQSLIFRSKDKEKIAAVVLGWSIYHKKSSTGLLSVLDSLVAVGRPTVGVSDGRTADGRDGSIVQSV